MKLLITRVLFICILLAVALALAAELPVVQPSDLARQMSGMARPAIFQVGPNMLYRQRRIPGAIYAGPGQSEEGRQLLRTAVSKLPKDREILLYCGCCPWENCPNIKPTIAMLQQMGYTKVKALYIQSNFKFDWTDKGYPTEGPTAQK